MPYSTVNRGPLAPISRAMAYADYRRLPRGISFAGGRHSVSELTLLADLTWREANGERCLDHRIFDEILSMIESARRLIVLDLFLFNDLLVEEGSAVRPLSRELTDALVNKKRSHPDLPIYFITDPCNTAWGGLPSVYFDELRQAGVSLIVTNLDVLRDSSPVYSFLWRAFVRPWGNRIGGFLPNPFGKGKITLRSLLNIPNMKANHRKTVIADRGDLWMGLVTSLNPHDASFAHKNVALKFDGPAVGDLLETERAVAAISGVDIPQFEMNQSESSRSDVTVQVLTEGKIRDVVVDTIDRATRGDRLSLILFYLAERRVYRALMRAAKRGAEIRIILDPSKDAFGWRKSGIPNRPVAHFLSRQGISVRWSDTQGEQCHTKLMMVDLDGPESLLLSGSANYTRRNLNDFNLETNVRIRGPDEADIFRDAREHFERLWTNEGGRHFTVDYERYEDKRITQHALYWLMESTGISTF